MRFFGLTPLELALAAAGAAGALYLLHRLRVRPREVRVPSLLFWRQAAEELRLRRLGRTFTHLRTYLFLLLLCLLGLTALADPRPGDWQERGVHHVLVVEAGTPVRDPARWEAVRRAARREVEALPLGDRVAVVGASSPARVLCGYEDPRPEVMRSLEALQPGTGPTDHQGALALASALARGRRRVQVVWVGGPAAGGDALPAGVSLRHVDVPGAAPPAVTGLVVEEPLRMRLSGRLEGPARLKLSWDGTARSLEVPPDGDDVRWVTLPEVPPAGQVVRITLEPEGGVTSRTAFRMPRRRGAGRIELPGAPPVALRLLVEADPFLTVAEEEADLRVAVVAGDHPLKAPVARVAGEPWRLPPELQGLGAVERAAGGGPHAPDSVLAAGEVVLARVQEGSPPRLELAAALFSGRPPPAADPAAARVLGRLLRAASGVRPPPVVLQAGELWELQPGPLLGRERRGAFWLRPARPGLLELADRPSRMTEPAAVLPEPQALSSASGLAEPRRTGGFALHGWELLACAVLLLLLADSWLNLTGRIP